jgi:hypothetical protein
MRNKIIIISIIATAFFCGYLIGHTKPTESTFHDMIVNHAHDLTALVTPDDKRVHDLAASLQTPENAYLYVRDHVRNDMSLAALPAGDIIEEDQASCLGKAILLCSLYRAMGIPDEDVRVVTGELGYPDAIIDHAWVDIEYNGECIQQDATDLLGNFKFGQFKGMAYTRRFIRKEGYAFNDEHFAVVSRLNLLKGSGHPAVQ